MTTVVIRDVTTTGEVLNEWPLSGLEEKITVEELIRSRIYQEVKDYNSKKDARFKGLIQPTATEKLLNKDSKKKQPTRPIIDWNMQYELAIDAFKKNQILILVDEQQVASLDQEIKFSPNSSVSFLRLVMLVGG